MTMKQITLGSKVVVSDPCYSIPTWCQEIVEGVKPGKYNVFIHKLDIDGWGERVCALVAIHEDHEFNNIYLDHYSDNIGVDSGQAGIFDYSSYRNDSIVDSIPKMKLKEEFTLYGGRMESGDEWYERICTHTLSEESWGTYDTGVVSSSGIGDGSYQLYTATEGEDSTPIIGFVINFGLDGNLIDNLEELFETT